MLKVLSGVARAESRGQFGKTIIAQMLVGSGSERLETWGLNRLSTFGILGNGRFLQREVVEMVDALTRAGLIESENVDPNRYRPVLRLSPAGQSWMKSRGGPELSLGVSAELYRKIRGVAHSEDGIDQGTGIDPIDPALLQSLKELRRASRTRRACPGIASSMTRCWNGWPARPGTLQDLSEIKGIGPSKLERYGAALLETIAAHEPAVANSEAPVSPHGPRRDPSPSPAAPTPDVALDLPTELWTWRLLERGFTIDEAVAIRGLDRPTVLQHAVQAARDGKPVPLSAFLDDATAGRWTAWYETHGESKPPPHPDHDGPPDAWPLFFACMNSQGQPTRP